MWQTCRLLQFWVKRLFFANKLSTSWTIEVNIVIYSREMSRLSELLKLISQKQNWFFFLLVKYLNKWKPFSLKQLEWAGTQLSFINEEKIRSTSVAICKANYMWIGAIISSITENCHRRTAELGQWYDVFSLRHNEWLFILQVTML